jgi:hypothetical protein
MPQMTLEVPQALAEWNRLEEDEASSHLQPEGEDVSHGIDDSH